MKRCRLLWIFTLASLMLSVDCNAYDEGIVVIPEQWRRDCSDQLNFLGSQLQYGSQLTGNVCVPPYYYKVTPDYTARRLQIVDNILGSSHDGTWVQSRQESSTKSMWYYDGPFLNADIDTLWLPQTLSTIYDGAFENGKVKVLVMGAETPPYLNNWSYPIFDAKLIVPTGSREAYANHDAWGKFSQIEEGAENSMPAWLVEEGQSLYELRKGEATVINGKGVLADDFSFAVTTYPVSSLAMASIDPFGNTISITFNSRISEFDKNYHLATSNARFQPSLLLNKVALDSIHVSPNNPVFASVEGVLYTKGLQTLLYFSRSIKHDNSNNPRIHFIPLCTNHIAPDAIPASNDQMGWNTVAICAYPGTEMCSEPLYVLTPKHNDFPVLFGDTIRALWSREGQCFDLHRYNTDATDIVVPGSLTTYGMTYPVKTVGKYMLYLNGRYSDYYMYFYLKGFEMGYSSKSDQIFKPFCNARTAIVAEGIEEIYNIFNGSTYLNHISLPQTLKIIGSYTFQNCSSLTEVVIPENVKCILDNAFYNCKRLKKVTLPANLEIIEYNVFGNCNDMKDIFCMGQTPPTAQGNLFGSGGKITPDAITLHVPFGAAEAYRTAMVWKDFTNIVEEDMTGIEAVTDGHHNSKAVATYSISGVKTNANLSGLNIIRYSDGSVRKVIKR